MEELITPDFPEYPEYREEETRPRVRVSCTHLHQHCRSSIFNELRGKNHGIRLGLTETQSTYNDRAVLLPLRLHDSPNGDENRGIPIELPRQWFLTGLNFGEQISFGKASSPNPLPPIREGYLDQFYLEWASGLSEPLPDFSLIVF